MSGLETLSVEELENGRFSDVEGMSEEATKAINEAYEDGLVDDIVEHIISQQEEFHRTLNEDGLDKIIRGRLFEKVAINSLPKRNPEYEALEEFILMSMKNPHMWRTDWANVRFLSPDERELLDEYVSIAPTETEADSRMKENDAIALEIVEDQATGEKVAVVTGLIEAKNYKLRNKGDAHEHASSQLRNAPRQMAETINRYKKVYPLLIKYLDLEGVLPERIDVVEEEKLRYTIAQPIDLKGQKDIPVEYGDCEFIYAPISRQEVFKASQAIRDEILENLPESNRNKIKMNQSLPKSAS